MSGAQRQCDRGRMEGQQAVRCLQGGHIGPMVSSLLHDRRGLAGAAQSVCGAIWHAWQVLDAKGVQWIEKYNAEAWLRALHRFID